MGVNRFSDIEERKRNETDAKAGDQVPNENREVVEKLRKRERES